MTLTFRCPAELEGVLLPPVPASLGLPDWLKAMPSQAFNAINGRDDNTVKRCPPFVDAMTSGFLIPLMCDLKVKNGEFTWDNDIPPGSGTSASSVHDYRARTILNSCCSYWANGFGQNSATIMRPRSAYQTQAS